MALAEPEKNRSTLRRWGISFCQTYETLYGSNPYVFRLQSQNRPGATFLGPKVLIAGAYMHGPESYFEEQLVMIRSNVSKDADSYRDKIMRHVDMWHQPYSTHFISATFNLAWVFCEAARRSQMAERESKFTLIVMRSAPLRDAGAFLGNDVLFKEAQANKSLKRLQNYTNSSQEILIPVIVTSNEIVATVPLPTGSTIPFWIATVISPDEAEYQPSESVSSCVEEGSSSSENTSSLSPSDTNEEQSKSSKDGSISISSSGESSEPFEDDRSESSSEDRQQIPDSNSSGEFSQFCVDCTSAYDKVREHDQEAQAKALAFAILPEAELEDIAVLVIDIWRWPTRLRMYDRWDEFREQQAAFDWPGRHARLLLSLKDSLDVNESSDGPTSAEQSVSVPSPISSRRKRKRPIIESSEDSGSDHPKQQDEQHDIKRARPNLSGIDDQSKELT